MPLSEMYSCSVATILSTVQNVSHSLLRGFACRKNFHTESVFSLDIHRRMYVVSSKTKLATSSVRVAGKSTGTKKQQGRSLLSIKSVPKFTAINRQKEKILNGLRYAEDHNGVDAINLGIGMASLFWNW